MGWEDAPIIAAAGQPEWMAAPIVSAAPRRTAEGVFEAIQAGYQGSATGLVIRGKLPDLFLDHSNSTWYEKALSSAGQIVSELPEMVVGGALGGGVGASVGATAGSVVPGVGTAAGGIVGGLLGTGAGAFAVPAAIRESYIQALTKGEVSSTADFLERTSIVLKSTAKEGAVGALTMGAGALIGRMVGKAVAPAIGESISVPTATRTISGTATAAELGTMVVAPAALEGRMPEPEDFLNAAIVLGGLKGAAHMAGGLARVWARTGIEPERVLADATRDPTIKEDLSRPLVVVEGGQMDLPGIPRAYQEAARAETAMAIVPGAKALEVSKSPFAEELPQVPGEPAKPAHVNYNYINTREEAKLALARLSEVYEAEITTQRLGAVSWEQSNAEAARVLADLSGDRKAAFEFLARTPGTPAGNAEILARKQLVVGAAEDMMRARDALREKGEAASPADQLAFIASIERAAMANATFLGARAEIGRALNIMKSTQRDAGQVSELLATYGKDPKALADMLMHVDSPAAALAFARKAVKATTWEKVVEAMKASMLSGPTTQLRNIIGNTSFMATRPVIDSVAAVFGRFRGSEADRVVMIEPIARVIGNLQGTVDGARMVAKILRTGEEPGKAEQFRQAIEGRKGEIIRLPFRFLSAADAFFKTMNERGEAYAQSVRQATKEGLDPTTREFQERVAELVENPTPAIAEASAAAAIRFTFNTPLGEKGAALQNLVRKARLEWAMPFIRTPGNILKETARLTPLSPLVAEWRAAIKKGGAERDKALAELATGSALMGGVFMAAQAGLISGAGDPDPRKRITAMAAGWQPYSIKVNGVWYSYRSLGPTETLVGLAADMSAVWDHMSDEESDKVPKILAVAFANAVTSQTALMGLTNIVNVTSDPTRYGPKFGQSIAGVLVPAIVAQPTAMADPVVRQVDSMLDAIKARIPGARQSLLPKRDPYGEPLQTKDRLFGVSPITMSPESTDKVRTEAERLGIGISGAPKKLHVGRGTGNLGDVEMTPKEQDVFRDVAGHVAHDILANIVNAPLWDDLPDAAKRKIYKRALLAARKQGAAAALPPEELGPVIQRITEQFETEAARK